MAYEHKGEFEIEHGLGLPQKTTAQRIAYIPPRTGYQVYDTDLSATFIYDGAEWVQQATGNDAVSRSGDTLTGALVLAADPTADLEAAPKQYVDAVAESIIDDSVSKSGDTLTGPLVLAADPTANLEAATKQYVDASSTNVLDDLTDVDTTTTELIEGDGLLWDGTNFVNAPVDSRISELESFHNSLVLNVAQLDTSTNPRVIGALDFPRSRANTARFHVSENPDTVGLPEAGIEIELDVPKLLYVVIPFFETNGNLAYVCSYPIEATWNGTTVTAIPAADPNDSSIRPSILSGIGQPAAANFNWETTTYNEVAAARTITLIGEQLNAQFMFSGVTEDIGHDRLIKQLQASINAQLGNFATIDQGLLADTALQDISALSIDGLVDVSITTPTTDHVIVHDGSNFVNRLLDKDAISDFEETDYVHITGDETIAGNKTFSDNLVVDGDLIVNGTTTTVDSADLAIADNKITLNTGESGAGITHASQISGLTVDRGTEENVCLVFDESSDSWKVGPEVGPLVNVATSHVETFVAADWATGTPNTFVLTQGTHNLPISPIYSVEVFENGSKVGIEVSVDPATGDVTISTVGATFDGAIRIAV